MSIVVTMAPVTLLSMFCVVAMVTAFQRASIETGYELKDRRFGVRLPVGSRIFSSPSLDDLEKRPLGRPRRRWVDNIKMDLGEI
jgi:hypothetical protein